MKFADDIVVLSESRKQNREREGSSLGKRETKVERWLQGAQIKNVEDFKY